MVVIRCSECGNVLVDTKKNYVNFAKGFDVELTYKPGKSEIVTVDCIICRNCGRKYSYSELTKRIETRVKDVRLKKKLIKIFGGEMNE